MTIDAVSTGMTLLRTPDSRQEIYYSGKPKIFRQFYRWGMWGNVEWYDVRWARCLVSMGRGGRIGIV